MSRAGTVKMGVANAAGKDAYEAAREGRTIFACRIRQDWQDSGHLSRELTNVAVIVEAIETEGWRLDSVSYYGNEKKPSGVYIFRPYRER